MNFIEDAANVVTILGFLLTLKWRPSKGFWLLALLAIGLASGSLYQKYSTEYKDTVDSESPIVDRKFQNEIVHLDGKVFKHCTFQNVTLHYDAKRAVHMSDSTFEGSIKFSTSRSEVGATYKVLYGIGFIPAAVQLGDDTGRPSLPVEPPKRK